MRNDINRLLEYSKKESLKWLKYPIESSIKDKINILIENGILFKSTLFALAKDFIS